jgi:UDP-N-acetylmuramyl pentapeptide phosphotransferase/UDP-N-acetylglucosamine-1-phosphate transferase
MEFLVFAAILSFVVAFITTPVVIKIADAKKLFDQPTAHKVHFTPIPTFGGISFFVAVLFSLILLVSFKTAPELQNFIAASTLVFFIGLKDDVYLISPIKKFLGQLLAVFLLTYQGDFQLNSLQGLMGIQELHPVLATVFTYLTFLVIINAFNLIDGVDGLAAMLGIVAGLFFGISFLVARDWPYAILGFSIVFSLIGFLFYNFSPARVFMGDTGSLFLGLVIAVLSVKFIGTSNSNFIDLNITETGAMAFAAVFIPIMDTLRVFMIRIYKGLSPFERDVNHFHHVLLNKGYSHSQISFILTITSIIFITVAYLLQPFGINVIISALLFLGLLFMWLAAPKGPRKWERRSTTDGKYPISRFNRSGWKRPEFNN